MALGIIIGTLPIVFFGIIIKVFFPDFDNSPLRSLVAIAIASIVMALLLVIAEKIGTRARKFADLDSQDGIIMGLAQSLALIPGVSRSGSTLTAGLFMGLERAAAARFSFLLGIPAISIAGIVELKGLIDEGFQSIAIVPFIAGMVTAIVSSYLSIAWLIRFLQTKSAWVFVWYRLAFGVAILAAIATGAIENQ